MAEVDAYPQASPSPFNPNEYNDLILQHAARILGVADPASLTAAVKAFQFGSAYTGRSNASHFPYPLTNTTSTAPTSVAATTTSTQAPFHTSHISSHPFVPATTTALHSPYSAGPFFSTFTNQNLSAFFPSQSGINSSNAATVGDSGFFEYNVPSLWVAPAQPPTAQPTPASYHAPFYPNAVADNNNVPPTSQQASVWQEHDVPSPLAQTDSNHHYHNSSPPRSNNNVTTGNSFPVHAQPVHEPQSLFNTPSRKRKRSDEHVQCQDQYRGDTQQSSQLVPVTQKNGKRVGSCIRCRMQHLGCKPDPQNPDGECLRCQGITGAVLYNLPCVRYKITDARLLDHEDRPRPTWTTRWSVMELTDIQDWQSTQTKTIRVTQDVGDLSIDLDVKEFVPVDGDALARHWVHQGQSQSYLCAPYAIVNMRATGHKYQKFVTANLKKTIDFYTNDRDPLIRDTYQMAYRYSQTAESPDERDLLSYVLRLWVASRMESRSERIDGQETLGMKPHNYGPGCANNDKILVPPVMTAQFEIIMTLMILRPLAQKVLSKLDKLVAAKNPQSWFTAYLVTFVLLHSCSLLTQADMKKAEKQGHKNQFFRAHLIKELHDGAKILLAYFHYRKCGNNPFSPTWNEKQNSAKTKMNDEQLKFVHETRNRIKANDIIFDRIRRENKVEHEMYFLSLLYDPNWKP